MRNREHALALGVPARVKVRIGLIAERDEQAAAVADVGFDICLGFVGEPWQIQQENRGIAVESRLFQLLRAAFDNIETLGRFEKQGSKVEAIRFLACPARGVRGRYEQQRHFLTHFDGGISHVVDRQAGFIGLDGSRHHIDPDAIKRGNERRRCLAGRHFQYA